MRIRVLFFGVLKDIVGTGSEEAEVPEGSSLGAVFESYAQRFPRLKEMEPSILFARNRAYEERSATAAAGDEVAFLPPVSGGTRKAAEIRENGNYFAITRRVIDTHALADRLLSGDEGAVVTFEGTVRNNTKGRRTRFLEYEAYEPMALQEIARIGRELIATRPICRIAIEHRVGRLLIGETAVAIVVTSPHRRPAFEAALEAIDRLKKTAPIWKKEYFEDGEVWVEGDWPRNAKAS